MQFFIKPNPKFFFANEANVWRKLKELLSVRSARYAGYHLA